MITASRLAGYLAAHALWSVSEGEMLIPLLAYSDENNAKKAERLLMENAAASVQAGKQKLASNDMDANDAAFVYDGRITLEGQTEDAVIVEFRAFFSPGAAATIAIPYTPKSSGTFTIRKPKLLAWENCSDFDQQQCFTAFFLGISDHEKGAAVWDKNFDKAR